MYEELVRRDAETAARIHPNDIRRAMRALEIMIPNREDRLRIAGFATGKKEVERRLFFIWEFKEIKKYWIQGSKTVQKSMYNNGLIAETQRLIDLNCSTNNTALQALGYKECYEYLTRGLYPRRSPGAYYHWYAPVCEKTNDMVPVTMPCAMDFVARFREI